MFKRKSLKSEGEVIITIGETITIVRNGSVEAEFGHNDYRLAGKYLGKMVSSTLEWMHDQGNWRLECRFDRR